METTSFPKKRLAELQRLVQPNQSHIIYIIQPLSQLFFILRDDFWINKSVRKQDFDLELHAPMAVACCSSC